MYKIFLISLLVSCASASNEPIFREDYKYYEEVNGWVKLHNIPANWHDARLRCHAEGASLASPSNFNMRNIMTSVMTAESADPRIGIYSGIHSTLSDGVYLSIEGVAVSDLPVSWAMGQPDHVYAEKCVVFHLNGTLENVQCSDAFEYICYKKFKPLTMNRCNTTDNEYTWDDRTRHCYKFHGLGKTWSQAYMICTAEGGYLAIINGDTEAKVLEELFAKYPQEKIFASHKHYAVIGFREWPGERSWYTVHGQTLENAGYAKWQRGEPNNVVINGETQDCGGITRSATLDDLSCIQQFPFICEKNPDSIHYN